MPRTMRAAAAVLVLAVGLFVTEALQPAGAVVRTPRVCRSVPAHRLCAIHRHFHAVNLLRARLGLRRIAYQWRAERHPARRDAILTYWLGRHRKTLHRWRTRPRAPWSAGWYAGAMCVHSKEGAWNANTGNGYFGGMQFDQASWLANGGGAYASRADLASAYDQLLIAYHYWSNSGWGPWPNTAAACGLL